MENYDPNSVRASHLAYIKNDTPRQGSQLKLLIYEKLLHILSNMQLQHLPKSMSTFVKRSNIGCYMTLLFNVTLHSMWANVVLNNWNKDLRFSCVLQASKQKFASVIISHLMLCNLNSDHYEVITNYSIIMKPWLYWCRQFSSYSQLFLRKMLFTQALRFYASLNTLTVLYWNIFFVFFGYH